MIRTDGQNRFASYFWRFGYASSKIRLILLTVRKNDNRRGPINKLYLSIYDNVWQTDLTLERYSRKEKRNWHEIGALYFQLNQSQVNEEMKSNNCTHQLSVTSQSPR